MWIFNSRGVAIVGIVATLLFLSVLGLTAANLITISQTLMSVEVQKERARMIAMAGLEYGLKNPAPTTKAFADGQFTVTVGSNLVTLTSVGTYGDAQETYSANMTTQAGCLKFNGDGATRLGKTVKGILLSRYVGCPSSSIPTTIDKITVSWDTTQLLTQIKIGSTTVYTSTSGTSSPVTTDTDVTVTTTTQEMTLTWKSAVTATRLDFVFMMKDGGSAFYTRGF